MKERIVAPSLTTKLPPDPLTPTSIFVELLKVEPGPVTTTLLSAAPAP